MKSRLVGLIGRKTFDGTIMLVPCCDVHTFGMKGPIDIAFVSGEGIVLETHRHIGPNRRLKNKQAVAVLERFSSENAWYEPGDLIHRGMGSGRAG